MLLISESSVETIILSTFACKADFMVLSSNDIPLTVFKFFLSIPLLPPRAGIIKTLRKFLSCYSTSTVNSISTEAFNGRTAIPTADLACFPLSPNISRSNSLAPFTTAGCWVKVGTLAT